MCAGFHLFHRCWTSEWWGWSNNWFDNTLDTGIPQKPTYYLENTRTRSLEAHIFQKMSDKKFLWQWTLCHCLSRALFEYHSTGNWPNPGRFVKGLPFDHPVVNGGSYGCSKLHAYSLWTMGSLGALESECRIHMSDGFYLVKWRYIIYIMDYNGI
jgi:hypothetical protein